MMNSLDEGSIEEMMSTGGAHGDTFHPVLQVTEKQTLARKTCILIISFFEKV